MKVLAFELKNETGLSVSGAWLEAYVIDGCNNVRRPGVLICPGGAYAGLCADREGEWIALNYNAAGYHAAVLHYSVAPARAPLQLREAAAAVRLMKEKAGEWGMMDDGIAVCGFSAGGHLAASLSTMWNCDRVFSREQIDSGLHRPDAAVLCYPVITCGEKGHADSFCNLCGGDRELAELFSVEKRVNDRTPPTFLWHTFEDDVVPVENSLMYAWALKENGVPFELHIYPRGGHGLGLVADERAWTIPSFKRNYGWLKLSVDFLNEKFGVI